MRPRQIALLAGLRCASGQLDLIAGKVDISANLAESPTESTWERGRPITGKPKAICLHCGKPAAGMFCSARCKAKFQAGMNRYAKQLAQLTEPEGSQDVF